MPIHKILLVDDSKTELHVLSELLTKRGYEVRTAENGEEALKRLQEVRPDLDGRGDARPERLSAHPSHHARPGIFRHPRHHLLQQKSGN